MRKYNEFFGALEIIFYTAFGAGIASVIFSGMVQAGVRLYDAIGFAMMTPILFVAFGCGVDAFGEIIKIGIFHKPNGDQPN